MFVRVAFILIALFVVSAFARTDKNGRLFLKMMEGRNNISKLKSGILYQVLIPSESGRTASLDTKVKFTYEGRLIDGTMFGSSEEDGAPTIMAPKDAPLKAWTEVLQLMKEGETWQIYVPSERAFASKDEGKIPPNNVIMFTMKMIEIMEPAGEERLRGLRA